MIKVLSMMKRKEGMSLDEFRRWLTEEHVKLARQIPGLEKFVVNIPVTDSQDDASGLRVRSRQVFGSRRH